LVATGKINFAPRGKNPSDARACLSSKTSAWPQVASMVGNQFIPGWSFRVMGVMSTVFIPLLVVPLCRKNSHHWVVSCLRNPASRRRKCFSYHFALWSLPCSQDDIVYELNRQPSTLGFYAMYYLRFKIFALTQS